MTTSALKHTRGDTRGFTMVELMIAMSLSMLVLAAVFTAFIMIARSSMRIVNYSAMETQTRRAFEQLAIDARMANSFVASFSGGVITSFTLTIPAEDLSSNRTITYGYDTSASSDGNRFYSSEVVGGVTKRTNLITGLKALTILRYTPAVSPSITPVLIPASTTSSTGIKHLQISVSVTRGGSVLTETTQVIRSTAFTLRNM